MDSAITHMNEHHKEELLLLARYITHRNDIKTVELVEIDQHGMSLNINNTTKVLFPFDENDSLSDIKNTIITKTNIVKAYFNKFNGIKSEISAYLDSFASVVLATVDKQGNPTATYAPVIKVDDNYYIYISEIADHYHNLKDNNKLEVLFLEDESKAIASTARLRLRFRTEPTFINKEDVALYKKVLDIFEEKAGKTVKAIRKLGDFHLVKLKFLNGRFVKGFGQAYSIVVNNNEFTIEHMKGGSFGDVHDFEKNKK